MKQRSKVVIVALSTGLTLLVLMGALLGQDKASQEPYKQLSVLSEVLSRIQTDYVEEPNFSNVTEGALRGLMESLDPFSSYLSPAAYKEYQKGPRGDASIGVVVYKRAGPPEIVGVVSVLPGSPAAQAGLKPGDIIESVDGVSTQDMSYAEVIWSLEGPNGSPIKLSVVQEKSPNPQPMELTRQVLRTPEIETRAVDPTIGYLKVVSLPKGESQKIAAKIKDLRKNGAQKFILDLRDNATGDLQEGVATANLFLKHGLIAYVVGQQYPRQSFTADENKAICDEPLEVLVNESTGGAAEIVAAAILDNHRGDVVGARTFGMGSIQRAIPLENGAALILSVAKYHSPDGKEIQETGVTPNVVVLQDREISALEDQGTAEEPSKPKEDLPLQRAIELLKAKDTAPQAA